MLLKSKRFLPLFITQFLGAFNDNLLKTAIITFVTYNMALNRTQEGIILNFISILFILPFFLVSATAGQVADKYERNKIAKFLKILEFILMFFAVIAVYFKLYYALVVILFFMSVQSAFFGPIKYSILPQHLKEHELIEGNAYIDGATFFFYFSRNYYGNSNFFSYINCTHSSFMLFCWYGSWIFYSLCSCTTF